MDTKKLRQKLLDLAIHGKLVPQDPNDEPASELLARIREEKLAMVERGELKPKDVKGDTVIFTGSDGLPYEKRADGKDEAKCIENSPLFMLTEGWVWARLGSLSAQINYGVSNSAERNGSHKLLRITDIDQQKVEGGRLQRLSSGLTWETEGIMRLPIRRHRRLEQRAQVGRRRGFEQAREIYLVAMVKVDELCDAHVGKILRP